MQAASFLLAAALAAGPRADVAVPAGAVELMPGDDIQAAVDAGPPGSTFHLNAGLYRLQTVRPKSGDVFIGAPGAVLNGARVLTDFSRSGANYVATGLAIDPETQVHGVCRKGWPRCDHPQDLYFDGRPLRAVDRLAKVKPGAWFYDYEAKAVYFADDPAGHLVELSHRPFAFGGEAKKVTVRNLVIENYACVDQQAAVGNNGEGAGWRILDNEIRWNHGIGAASGRGSLIARNKVHHNGEMGLGGGASDGSVVSGNEIAFNVWNGTDCIWECGGAKWAVTDGLTVRGNSVHDNHGPGLWTDIDAVNVVYEDNDIERNLSAGISHEISGKAVIRRNLLKGNGARTFLWGWAGQIQVQNSRDVEVYGNTLVLDPRRGGNGVIVIQQRRGAEHMPRDNSIHDNDITMAGGTGAVAGWFADYRWDRFSRTNRWNRNHYHLGALSEGEDVWAVNDWVAFDAWQASGQDHAGTVDGDVKRMVAIGSPVRLTPDRAHNSEPE
jgi:hypothetical protein